MHAIFIEIDCCTKATLINIPFVLSVIDDGNCLFRACSKAITGDQTLQSVLRILTCLELYNHAEFYAYHPRYKEEWKSSGCSFGKEDSIFTASLSEKTTLKYYNLVNKAIDDRRMCVQKEAEFICSLGESVVLPFVSSSS